MQNPFETHGMFSWTELMTTDPASARLFYGQVFGWRYKDDSGPAGPYTEILVAGESVGGILASPPGCPAPPCWNNYVTVAEIDKTVAQAQALGGGIALGPKDIPGVGRFAVVRDGQGADLLAIQYTMEKLPAGRRADPMATPGSFSWVELMTPDPPAAREFYGGLFGWTFEKASGFDYEIARLGEQMIAGMMAMPQGCPPDTPPCWNVYVTVVSADETCATAKSLGGRVHVDPQDIPTVGRFAVIQDAQGAVISMFQWAR